MTKETVKTEEKTIEVPREVKKQRSDDYTVFVGGKPFMNPIS